LSLLFLAIPVLLPVQSPRCARGELGTILPPEQRAVRDLARKHMQPVRSRTTHILAVENITARQHGARISSNQVKHLTAETVDGPKGSVTFPILQRAIGERHLTLMKFGIEAPFLFPALNCKAIITQASARWSVAWLDSDSAV
jgi:hypothetical protein